MVVAWLIVRQSIRSALTSNATKPDRAGGGRVQEWVAQATIRIAPRIRMAFPFLQFGAAEGLDAPGYGRV
jgi:hypothetical protein